MKPSANVGSLFLLAASAAAAPTHACTPLADVIAANPRLSSLQELVHASDLPLPTKPDGIKRTLFAPVNSAHLSDDVADQLLGDMAELRTVLEGHIVVDGALTSADLDDGLLMQTAAGTTLSLDTADFHGRHKVTVHAPHNGAAATVLGSDISACDTVIHLVDMLLVDGNVRAEAMDDATIATTEVESNSNESHKNRKKQWKNNKKHGKNHHRKHAGVISGTYGQHSDIVHEPLVEEQHDGYYGDEATTLMYGGYGDFVVEMFIPGAHKDQDEAVVHTTFEPVDANLKPRVQQPASGAHGDAVTPATYGGYGDVATEPPIEDWELGGSADEDDVVDAGLEDLIENTGTVATGSSIDLDGDSNTAAAAALVVGAVAAGIIAALAALAGVVYAKKRAAIASVIAADLSSSTV